jgi:Fe-S cluster biosynthesis and repair protein YggX
MAGPLGERIYNEVSQEAWTLWVKHSTMVINEFRLNPAEPQARVVLRTQMEDFLFGSGGDKPPDYVPPK